MGVAGTAGDYRDTLVVYRDLNYTVRFVAPFQGLMMIHCHVLKHEDLGMMTLANITAAPVSLALFSEALWAHRLRFVVATAMVAALVGVSALTLAFVWFRQKAPSSCGCYRRCPEDDTKQATS